MSDRAVRGGVERDPRPGRGALQQPADATRRGRRWPTVSTVVGALIVAWCSMLGLRGIADNSFFTHLATGRVLVEGEFPRGDIYSFTALNAPWTIQSWLPSLIYGLLDRWYGVAAIRLLGGVLAGLVGLAIWQLARPAKTLLSRVVCVLFPVVIGVAMWSPRPLMFGLVFLGVAMLAVERRVPAPLLLPVFWLWANAHGSFPLGLVAIGCVAVGAKLDGDSARHEVRTLAWAAGGAVAGVIGPLGVQVLLFPGDLLGRSEVLRRVVEWQSPDFGSTSARVFLLQVAIGVLLLVRRPSYRGALPLVVFLGLALVAQRNIPLAAIVMVPGFARAMPAIGSLDGSEDGVVPRIGVAAVVAVACVLGWRSLSGPDLDLSTYPVEAVAWMDAQGLRASGGRVATDEVVGNYLELVDGRDASVFLDDRFDMYPRPVVDDHLVLRSAQPGWAEVLDRWQIDSVLWDRRSPLVELLGRDPAWHMAYQDAGWAVVCRRGSAGC